MNVAPEIQQILVFFIFVAPGFLFSRSYIPYRPIQYYKKPNIFDQTALLLIGSALIHGALISIVALIVLITQLISGQLITLGQFLLLAMPLEDIPLVSLAAYLLVIGIYVLISLLVGRRAGVFFGKQATNQHPWWTRIIGENLPENTLFWAEILQMEALQKGILSPQVVIHMRSGETFEGKLDRLKLVGDEEDSIELAITHVTYHSAEHDQSLPPISDHIVLLQSKDILWVSRVDV